MEMEKITLPKFDHTAKDLEGAFGFSDKISHYVRNCIVFECLACPLMAKEFFDRESDIPENMISLPGIMERVDTHMRTRDEQLFMFMIFMDGFNHINNAIEKTNEMLEKGGEDVKKEQEVIGSLINKLTGHRLTTVHQTIDLIRECNFDFDKYIVQAVNEDDYDVSGKFSPEIKETSQEEVKDLLKDMLLKALEERDKAKKKNKKASDENSEEN